MGKLYVNYFSIKLFLKKKKNPGQKKSSLLESLCIILLPLWDDSQQQINITASSGCPHPVWSRAEFCPHHHM